MMKKRRVFHFVCYCTIVFYSFMLPLQAMALTVGEERKIGDLLLYSVRKEMPILDDPDISQYINKLGNKVLEAIGPQFFDYRFFVVKSNQFNAFAAPAGLVFFYTGLIETMHSEDELLSVMAHEIGHVVSRHIAQHMEKGTRVSALSLLFGIAGLALGVPGLSPGLMVGSMATGQAINLQYSREDEEQADRLSFGWMQKMHRNPSAMEDVLKVMRKITRYRVGTDTPQYLLTHPNPEARLGYVESLIEHDANQKIQGAYAKADNFDFLRFKYRVMMHSIDHDKLRMSCVNLLTSAPDKEQQIMAQYGLALLESDEHNLDQALQYIDAVKKQYPTKEILEIDKAIILRDGGRGEDALQLFENAVRRNPNDMFGTYHLAKMELMKGRSARAEQLLRKVAMVMPEYPQLYFDLGQIEADRGKEGVSGFYLAKYNLYLGKMKIAKQYFTRTTKDATVPDKLRSEDKIILEQLKELEKGV